ncbi:MAG: DUF4230 domain-containing protein [Microthrixaceae bacterium]
MGTLKKERVRLGAGVMALLAALVLCVVALVVVGFLFLFDPFSSETVDRSGPTVLQQIRTLEEFTAAEGSFTQDVDLEEDARYLPDFLKGERVVALVTGTVRATVDFGQLDEDAVQVDESTNTIRLRLPEPVLSDADIDEGSARVISRDRGLMDRVDDFFSANPTEDGPLYQAAEQKVEAAARESDLIDEARQNTEQWLTTFLGAAGFDHVEITWTDSPT